MAQHPRYVPEYDIQINGSPLPSPVRSAVTSVSYQDGLNAADRVEVGLANPDLRWLQSHIKGLGFQPFPTGVKVGALGSISAAPEGTFDIDNKLVLKMGYAPDSLEEMFKGEVTGIQASFPGNGMPTMTLIAHDYLNRLTRGSYSRGFGPVPDMLIATILCAENLLIPLLDPAIVAISTAKTALDVIFKGSSNFRQEGESDLELMQRIANQYDADFWVNGDTFVFARFMNKEYAPRLTLTWGESLLSFSPQISTIGQVAAVTKRFTLRELPLSFLVTVGWDFDRESLNITVVPGEAGSFAKAASGPALTIVDQPISSPADIANSAFSIYRTLRKKLNRRLTGSGSAVGDPRIRAGAVIELDGLGPDFSGDSYRVTSARHTMDTGGYRTDFEVQKEILP
jgi:phage protein D